MDLYGTVFEVIDMRSFSNLWYWIALAVLWSTASHWVLGVPFDMVQRAKRGNDPQAVIDFEDMVRINTNRLIYIGKVSGVWLLALGCGIVTALIILGFWYGIEFAQALFLFAFPLSIIGAMSSATANRISREALTGEPLLKRMSRHRLYTQIIGMFSVFVTSMWGMYQNLAVGPLGG